MLTNKKVVVVGGASGIGFAVAQQAQRAGAEVVIASRSLDRLRDAVGLLGEGVSAEMVDAADEQSARAFFARVGPFDHLAVTIKPQLAHQRFSDSDMDAVRAAFDAKFWGQYRLLQHALATIRPQGSIVLTSGIAARRGSPGLSGAAAINAATEALAQSLAIELAPLRINTVSPGLIARQAPRGPLLDGLAQYLPLKREGVASEVAEAFLYLFCNHYATGSVIVVDGGALC